jgi:excinuclease ABC subunit C
LQEKQRIASAENEDADVFGYHFDKEMLAVGQFHMREGKIVDKRDFFWEDLPELVFETPEPEQDEVSVEPTPGVSLSEHGEPAAVSVNVAPAEPFSPALFFSAFLKQLYLDQPYIPRTILVPLEFPDRVALASLLTEQSGRKVEILAPQRGDKRSLVDLVGTNAKQSYDQRFRTLAPSKNAIANALQDALGLPETPTRIECFDISHIAGAETVASMVVWEHGEMKKADYRKFKVKSVSGVDDFASMHEILVRRYSRLQANNEPFPSLILIDGGLGQLHAAYAALESIGITLQPLASIAKREEVIYVYGQEDDPVVLDRRSPVLHLVQRIRDESHRFAITYHRKRREMRDRDSELLEIPGVGDTTRKRLIEHFGSLRGIKAAGPDALTAVVNAATAKKIRAYFDGVREAAIDGTGTPNQPETAPELRILQ